MSGAFRVPLSISPPGENPSPAGIAYSNIVNWLLGAQMVSMSIDSNGTWAAGLQRLGFTNAHVVWNPDVTANFSIPASWNVFQMRDLSNNVTVITGVANLSVGIAPVILDTVPSLAISLVTNNSTVTIAWPGPATGFNLYSTTNLAPAIWLTNGNAVTKLNGNIQVSLPRGITNRFFRLSSP